MPPIHTQRLTLLPLTAAAARAATANRDELSRLLGVRVPDAWPQPDFREILPLIERALLDDPSLAEWTRIIAHTAEDQVIGDIGFKGKPDKTGTVEMGYSVIPDVRRQGFAFEAAQGLVGWAFRQPNVRRITAECEVDNLGSIRILEKLDMQRLGQEGSLLKWELDPQLPF